MKGSETYWYMFPPAEPGLRYHERKTIMMGVNQEGSDGCGQEGSVVTKSARLGASGGKSKVKAVKLDSAFVILAGASPTASVAAIRLSRMNSVLSFHDPAR